MPVEIERKYLPKDPAWRPAGAFDPIVQGYFWPGKTADAFIERTSSSTFQLLLTFGSRHQPWSLPLPMQDGQELHGATGGKLLTKEWTLRVRHSGSRGGEFCLKGKACGLERPEFEYLIPPADTQRLFSMCPHTHITKDRYSLPHAGHTFEVDVFRNPAPQHPAVLIEVELAHAGIAPALPDWAGEEVTGVKGYTNARMAKQRWRAANPG